MKKKILRNDKSNNFLLGEELKKAFIKKIFRDFASKGGLSRAKKLSKKQRSDIARIAATARWKKKKKK